MWPVPGTLPEVGLSPAIPHTCAGPRILPASVAAHIQRRSAGGDDSRRAAAATGRAALEVIGIVGAAVHVVIRDVTERQFRSIGLADDYRAGRTQPRDDRSVFRGQVPAPSARPPGADQATGIERVFDSKGQPVQRPRELAARQVCIQAAGLLQGPFGIECDDCVQLWIDRIDPRQVRFHALGA